MYHGTSLPKCTFSDLTLTAWSWPFVVGVYALWKWENTVNQDFRIFILIPVYSTDSMSVGCTWLLASRELSAVKETACDFQDQVVKSPSASWITRPGGASGPVLSTLSSPMAGATRTRALPCRAVGTTLEEDSPDRVTPSDGGSTRQCLDCKLSGSEPEPPSHTTLDS